MIDLVGTKDKARGGRGSALMRSLHRLVIRSKPDLPSVQKAYTWNDSVLLLSFITAGGASYAAAMSDAHLMKHCIDKLEKCFAVAVKGQAFPPPAEHDPAVTFIAASSWAMANCFQIAGKLKTQEKAWYIDSRIASKISPGRKFLKMTLPLLPSLENRCICLFEQYPLA